ncbi:lipid kinase YegS [Acerihabitans arboris]|uniref:Probable lipid kinase YegS-like n=1 Tax=Acerihabitans arboris TaxID=2691583 RepID=A0A845SR66_9GAMM|nr:lipid kinase YegS [Acerihabitans arboris]NDL65366.1 lipid kinase YegS [Acerihabitans arboris]
MLTAPAALLIVNGKSAGDEELRMAVERHREAGYPLHVRVTWEHGDAQRYVEEAARLRVETVIAGGGDGTINEIAGALVLLPAEHRPCLGILPLGTANDFALSCAIPQGLDKALALAINGKPADIDIAQVNHDRYFINMATGGFGTRITSETPAKLKSALGGASYFIHGLLRMDTLKADSCEIKGPGFNWAGEALVIGIGNGRQAGGGQALCPDALINDGLLQLRVYASEALLPILLNSLTSDEQNPHVISASLPWLEIEAPHEVTFNLDGEPLKGKKFLITVLPAALTCRLPPLCPLLG